MRLRLVLVEESCSILTRLVAVDASCTSCSELFQFMRLGPGGFLSQLMGYVPVDDLTCTVDASCTIDASCTS